MNVHLPATLDQLWPLLESGATLMAGGTDLLVRQRITGEKPEAIACLDKIDDLDDIIPTEDELIVGSCVPLTTLMQHEVVAKRLPVLHQALRHLGSPLIRNMGTIGGNICTASPAGDTLPPLYVLDAKVQLRCATSIRTLPLDEFITGPGQTALQTGEILDSVIIPYPDGTNLHYFEKVGQREALAISVVSLAAVLSVRSGVVQSARLAWGSVGPTIITSQDVENSLEGEKLTLATLHGAADLARQAVSPISDVRATAEYRRQVAGNLLLRLATL